MRYFVHDFYGFFKHNNIMLLMLRTQKMLGTKKITPIEVKWAIAAGKTHGFEQKKYQP